MKENIQNFPIFAAETNYYFKKYKERRQIMKKLTLIISLLSVFVITNAQVDETRILDSATVQKNELKMTPEIEEMVITTLKNWPEEFYSNRGININKEQLENLHLGKPIPWYNIKNEQLEPISTYSVPRMAAGEPFSLRFFGAWNVPVMSDGEPLLFGIISFSTINGAPSLQEVGIKNTIEHFHNYEYKDSIIGSVGLSIRNMGMDFLIIRKEHKDIFVEVYDKATGEYFKNEYGPDELITLLIDWDAKEKEAKSRYYDFVADKSELILTPEITEMLNTKLFSRMKDWSDHYLSQFGIKDRAQLEHLHLGKPIPTYTIVNENLTFTGSWTVQAFSNGELFYAATVQLEDDGKYGFVKGGSAGGPKYEHEELIVGFLTIGRTSFLIIRKDNKEIFVMMYDWKTGEYYKNEYSLSEIINLLKK